MIKKKTALLGAIVIILTTSLLTAVFSNIIAIRMGDRVVISRTDYEYLSNLHKDFSKMLGLKDFISEYYYKPVEDDSFNDGIIKGLFESLEDPYSVYMTKTEFDSFKTHTEGTYGGIGVVVSPGEDGYITVVTPIEDTPGARAGIKSGDKIVKVNDKEVIADKLDEAVAMMKGKPGTKVDLTLIRANNLQPFTVTIEREEIRLQTVKSEMLNDQIGYLRITMFDEITAEDFKEHLKKLESKNIKGLVIDLRNNPGGSLSECVEIADELLGEQTIVYTMDRAKNKEYEKSDANKVNYPYVILVNGGSASASEIVTGAVKDTKSGTIIGTTTFGKGLVQMVKELQDGTGFKLTISQYFTPNGNYIHGKGIEPDVIIDLPEELKDKAELSHEEDVQLQKALEVLKKQM